MRKGKITVCEKFNGEVTLLYKKRKLKYKTFKRREKQLPPQDSKTLNKTVDETIAAQNANQGYKIPVVNEVGQ